VQRGLRQRRGRKDGSQAAKRDAPPAQSVRPYLSSGAVPFLVAQTCSLLYRRFAIGRYLVTWGGCRRKGRLQVGNLRYGRLQVCVTCRRPEVCATGAASTAAEPEPDDRPGESGRPAQPERLVARVGGGRYALLEIMGSDLRTQESIRLREAEGKSYEIIEASEAFRWRTFDFSALEGYELGKITEETGLLYCTKRGPVTRGIDNIKKTRGESTHNMHSLRMKAMQNAARTGAPPPPIALKLK